MLRLSLFIFILFFFFSFGRSQTTTPPYNSIERAINQLKNDPALKHASISFLVKDIDKDTIIASHNPKNSLVPASTMKIVTTATALQLLGSYNRFKTYLQYDGYIDSNCTLHGNIYIKGGGDPTLGSRFFKNKYLIEEWSHTIANLGITNIDGKIIGDASHFSYEYVPSTWSWGDMGNYYGTGISGLSIYDNTTHFYFNSGLNKGDSTTIECVEPYTPDLEIKNTVRSWTTKKDEAYIYGAPYDGLRIVKGNIPLNKESFDVRGSMHEPAYTAAFELEASLWRNGISVLQPATTTRRMDFNNIAINKKRTNFDTITSPSISKIVYWTNLISNNLFAEHLLKHIGVKKYKNGSVYSSTLAVSNYWKRKGILTTGFYMNDGSGLSRYNAVSADHLVSILTYMKKKSKFSKTFYSSLPIAGKTGTLKSIGRKTKIQGNLRAKSGTMTRVKSYAGYVKSASGKNLCFAIIVNNHTCNGFQIKKKLEKIMVSLGNYYN